MKLIVTVRELRYAAVQLKHGDEFEASDTDAMILKAIGKAKDADQPQVKAGTMNSKPVMEPKSMAQPEPVVSETLPSMTTRKYKRRDMAAES